MSLQAGELDGEPLRNLKAREGDPEALAELRQAHHSGLVNILLSRGANRTEAEDLLADLWADCVPAGDEKPSLLEKFSGKCTLQGWLATVATRRWIDLKRRQARRTELNAPSPGDSSDDALGRLPAATTTSREDVLVDLLRSSLRAAFAQCAPEAMVMLRLVYLHGLTQREIVRMLAWHESKVSRLLSSAMQEIESRTLAELKRRDPWLELTWQDFLDLCETHEIGFL